MKFEIQTSYNLSQITQEVISDCGLIGLRETLFKQVIDLQDLEVEKALVLLGWSTPTQTREFKQRIEQLEGVSNGT